jgi:hypothetical protein
MSVRHLLIGIDKHRPRKSLGETETMHSAVCACGFATIFRWATPEEAVIGFYKMHPAATPSP